ncbi:sodium/glutamate symporter [Bilophila wadsworthia]|uniref:sodium/glutamate symporter n=1 Tax=Bilophila wadsworthia TaxID=35833 RepID=UPI00242A9AD4|nr:sodium/glutamate symporter [Bilophila wadsworthia]
MESTFYPYLGALGWTGLFLLIGTIIRAKVKFFQTFLFPASLIGGIIGFFVLNAGWLGIPSSTGWKTITPVTFSTITFHLFAFGFVGIGLLQAKSGTSGKVVARGALWIALIFGLLFSVQAMVGKGTFDVWKLLFGGDFFTGNGYLLGAGFTQGPGQTQAYASIWETTYKISNSLNVGLAFAAVGFLVAGLVGVPLAFYGIKKGWVSIEGGKLPQCFLRGLMDKGDNPTCARSTTHPANIDSVAFHLAIMATLYALAYAFGVWWLCTMPKGINGLGIGMIFAWGMFFAMIARKLMAKFDLIHLLDGETTRRLTGATVDFMICAVFMGIQVRQTLFGYCTGTAASGLLLLRIVDPEFDTPVAVEVGLMNVFATILFKPISWSMPFVPVEGFPMLWIFVAVTVVTPIVMYFLKMIRKPAF